MKQFFTKTKTRITRFYTERSTLAFFVTLAILFALIAVSHFLRTPDPAPEKPARETKKTALYGENSPVYLQAVSKVKKEGVTPIVALTPGIVTAIITKPGIAVQNGTTILTLTNDYQSGAASLEKEIARNNLLLVEELNRLDKAIENDQERIAKNDPLLTKREERVQLQNLKKARETREINLRNAELNYRLQTVSDAVLKPRAMSAGFVQSVGVKKGDYVTPGQTLATISNAFGNTVIEARVISEVAAFVDITKEAKITLSDGSMLHLVPTYFSASEDEDGMFAIQFMVPDEAARKISVTDAPKVELPLRFTHEATILVPLDAVFKNSNSAVVLVAKDGKAEARSVELGRVRGNYVEVPSGLEKNDQIILNRFVLAGDSIEVIR